MQRIQLLGMSFGRDMYVVDIGWVWLLHVHFPLFWKLPRFLLGRYPFPPHQPRNCRLGYRWEQHFSFYLPDITLVQGWTCSPVPAKEQMQDLLRLLGESNVLFLTELELGVHFAIQTSCYRKCSLSKGCTNMEEARSRDGTRSYWLLMRLWVKPCPKTDLSPGLCNCVITTFTFLWVGFLETENISL